METKKEEAIRKSFGEYWDQVKDKVANTVDLHINNVGIYGMEMMPKVIFIKSFLKINLLNCETITKAIISQNPYKA